MNQKIIKCSDFEIGNNRKIVLISGPCQMESEDHAIEMAYKIKEITSKLNINLIYKTSFDKANRTSIGGKRGIGLEKSLKVFDKIKNEVKLPTLTDVHSSDQCSVISDVIDVIQIPAFLCRQTDLLIAAAKTDLIVNVKKGQFLAPLDMINVSKKIEDSGNKKILLTERGASFGYNNLVSDMRSLEIMKSEIGYPVIFDATHSVQSPGGMGDKSGGDRKYVPALSKAATAVGVAGVFMETHNDPDNAPSDGPNMVKLEDMSDLIKKLIEIDNLVKEK